MSARRWLGIVILGMCLGGPIAEAFDWWDQALPTGNDTETAVVVVALSVGLAIAVAGSVGRWFQSVVARAPTHRHIIRPARIVTVLFAPRSPNSSPPSPLRI